MPFRVYKDEIFFKSCSVMQENIQVLVVGFIFLSPLKIPPFLSNRQLEEGCRSQLEVSVCHSQTISSLLAVSP